jgi:hypothetical protein
MKRGMACSLVRLRSAPASGILRVAAFLLLCSTSGSALVESQARPAEYDVKAAYLLNFGKFIRGSPNAAPREHFDICVIGPDPMGRVLDSLAAGEQVDGRPVRIRRVNDAADARSCDIAYFSTSDTAKIDSELVALRNSDALTVSDAPNFLEHGGMIQFVLVAQRVRFSVNLNAVHRTHLVLSSELLRVALSVTGKATGEVRP